MYISDESEVITKYHNLARNQTIITKSAPENNCDWNYYEVSDEDDDLACHYKLKSIKTHNNAQNDCAQVDNIPRAKTQTQNQIKALN